jgi:hypothetical protein
MRLRTTLINLDDQARRASPELGRTTLGELQPDSVQALLERFQSIDPIENVEADPEIILEYRQRRQIVRTGQGRLQLYDPRNLLEPALQLSPAEIIAELDGSAAAARSRAVTAAAEIAEAARAEEPLIPPPVPALNPAWRLTLITTAAVLAAYLVFSLQPWTSGQPETHFEPIATEQEATLIREEIAGVYMTGNQPGSHGISLSPDGAMKIFQLNAEGVPSLIQDSYEVGRVRGILGVRAGQGGEPMMQTGRHTLSFFGESYQRLQ